MTVAQNHWGTAHKLGRSDRAPALPFSHAIETSTNYLWRPQGELKSELPEDQVLAILCCEVEDGVRIFSPLDTSSTDADIKRARKSLESDPNAVGAMGPARNYKNPYRQFFFAASLLGNGIRRIETGRQFDVEDPTPDMLWYLFLRAHGIRSFSHRKFNSIKDLVVTEINEFGKPERVLSAPWPLDASTAELGFPQDPNELMTMGRAEANLAGIAAPTTSQAIHFALAAAARLLPSPPYSDEQVATLMKKALFQHDDDVELTPELEKEIKKKLYKAIHRRIETKDESQDDFNAWFFGTSGTLVKQIAQSIKEQSPADATRSVTHVLCELGFRAFQSVSESIALVMHDFADGLPEPLSDVERYCFEQLYFPQRAYGGLSLIVLGEKLQFAEGVLWQLVLPSSDAADARSNFYTLLKLYSQLAELTRRSDRVRKAPIDGTPVGTQEDELNPDEVPQGDLLDVIDSAMVVARVIDYLQAAGKLECNCNEGQWQTENTEPSGAELRIQLKCLQCGVAVGPLNVKLSELRDLFLSDNDEV